MADLIYRETARRIIDSPRNKDQMLYILETQPAVDAVEVVRCKDCRNSGWADDFYGNKSMWCELLDIPVEEAHYCEYGEK